MDKELQNDIKAVEYYLHNADIEKATAVLILLLGEHQNIEYWQKQIWNLISLKKQISLIPPEKRTFVHSLLEQTVMVCIEKSLNGDISWSFEQLQGIFNSELDSSVLISPQESLQYKLGQLAMLAVRILAKNHQWKQAAFFLTQAQSRQVILNHQDYFLLAEVWRNNQQPTKAIDCYKKALQQI